MRPFKGGWAILPFHGRKAHFWEDVTKEFEDFTTPRIHKVGGAKAERVRTYSAICGGVLGHTYGGVPALAPGNFDRCKNCIRARSRMIKRGLTSLRAGCL